MILLIYEIAVADELYLQGVYGDGISAEWDECDVPSVRCVLVSQSHSLQHHTKHLLPF